jgi:hypothetical protein
LSKNGRLKHYSVHKIENSPWIDELEKRNSVHPQHDRKPFLKDSAHYIFTIHDSTLECVVIEGEYWKPNIQICLPDAEAESKWSEILRV